MLTLLKKLKTAHPKILFVLGGILGAIGLHWIAIGLEHNLIIEPLWCEHHGSGSHSDGYLLLWSTGILLMIIGGLLVYYFRDVISGTKLKDFYIAARSPRKCMIFTVSTENFRTGKPRLLQGKEKGTWKIDATAYLTQEDLSLPTSHEKLKRAIDNAPDRWPWQQILRGIEPHLPVLKQIYLIGSSGEKGSFSSLARLRGFLQACLPDLTILIVGESISSENLADTLPPNHSDAIDFEDFDALSQSIKSLIARIKKRDHYQNKDIVIDATGGQKTTSIAAASATLNSGVVFQYVQTSHPNEVLTYNTHYESPHGVGH